MSSAWLSSVSFFRYCFRFPGPEERKRPPYRAVMEEPPRVEENDMELDLVVIMLNRRTPRSFESRRDGVVVRVRVKRGLHAKLLAIPAMASRVNFHSGVCRLTTNFLLLIYLFGVFSWENSLKHTACVVRTVFVVHLKGVNWYCTFKINSVH